ncbi:MAG: NUDIX pyrophosphatase [Bacteroidota bacterium]
MAASEHRPPIVTRVVDVYPYRLDADGQPAFLLLRRSPEVAYSGQWRMVGGKMEPGETAWQAALRELHEETSLTPQHFWALPSYNGFYEWQHDRVNLIPAFAAQVTADPVLDREHDAFAWYSVSEARQALHWPEQRRLLRLAAETLADGIPEALVIPIDER